MKRYEYNGVGCNECGRTDLVEDVCGSWVEYVEARKEIIDSEVRFKSEHSKDNAVLLQRIQINEQIIQKLKSLLRELDEETVVPDKACSCHNCPPCNDCVDYSRLRDIKERVKNMSDEQRSDEMYERVKTHQVSKDQATINMVHDTHELILSEALRERDEYKVECDELKYKLASLKLHDSLNEYEEIKLKDEIDKLRVDLNSERAEYIKLLGNLKFTLSFAAFIIKNEKVITPNTLEGLKSDFLREYEKI